MALLIFCMSCATRQGEPKGSPVRQWKTTRQGEPKGSPVRQWKITRQGWSKIRRYVAGT